MISIGELVLSALASAAACGLWTFFYHLRTPLRHLPGPKSTSLIYGNLLDISMGDNLNSIVQEVWVKEYGNTLKFKGFFGTDRLLTVDTCAINHILTHVNDYAKPSYLRRALAQILGEGEFVYSLLKVHNIASRHILNPAFGPAQIRGLTDIFLAKAIRLRDLWLCETANTAVNTDGARFEIMSWLNRTSLDVIGLAGKFDFSCFNYNIDALGATEKPNELNVVFATVLSAFHKVDVLFALQVLIPCFRFIVTQRTMERIGRELLTKAKATVLADATEKGGIDKSSIQGRDLLTLLVKANMATDIPENQRLPDKDVLAQVPTFLVAGHETTSTATTWALHELSLASEIQTKLREELVSVDTEMPSMDQLSALPYLDAVVKETLRLHPPIGDTMRVATKDDVLPLEKPFTDKHGVIHDGIRVSKGTVIFVPILVMNRSKELWGPDAHEFKPKRWDDLPNAVSKIPGVWGNMLTFLGGPRACIAYRFAIIEMKVLLFTLVRAFEFEPAVPANQIGKRGIFLQRPILRGDPTNKAQLPLFVKRYQRGD
ncbi:cytochrome P450 [Paxillus ammoniavirescens]|nr:cytochrome P450 [Paxillus ammoniavirescens]